MADAYDDSDFGIRDSSSWRGRGGGRYGTGWRGSGRGERGSGIGRGSGTTWRGARGGRGVPIHDSLEGQPMGDLLETITLTELQSSVRFKDLTPTITDCQYVASYNWLNGGKANILVPGQYSKEAFADRPPQLIFMKAHHLLGAHQKNVRISKKITTSILGTQMLRAIHDSPLSRPFGLFSPYILISKPPQLMW